MGDCNSKCAECEYQDRLYNWHSSKKCLSPVTCTCKTCCVGGAHDIAQKTSAILGGAALTGAGIAVCVLSGGIAAPFIGAAVIGGGSSLAFNGLTKSVKGEKMDAVDLGIDTAVGTIAGLVTTGGVAANKIVKKVAEEAVKKTVKETTIKTSVNMATELAASAMKECADCYIKPLEKEKRIKGEKRKFNPHSLLLGALKGGSKDVGSCFGKKVLSKGLKMTTATSKFSEKIEPC